MELTLDVWLAGQIGVELTLDVWLAGQIGVELTLDVWLAGQSHVELTLDICVDGQNWMELTLGVWLDGQSWVELTKVNADLTIVLPPCRISYLCSQWPLWDGGQDMPGVCKLVTNLLLQRVNQSFISTVSGIRLLRLMFAIFQPQHEERD